MMNQIISTGMTEKRYFEVHASQAEFLDWYHKQASLIMKTKRDCGYG